MSDKSGSIEAVADNGYTEREVADLLRDLLMEVDGLTLGLSVAPVTFTGVVSSGVRASGVIVTFEDGSLFELTVRRRMGPKRS